MFYFTNRYKVLYKSYASALRCLYNKIAKCSIFLWLIKSKLVHFLTSDGVGLIVAEDENVITLNNLIGYW